MRHARSPAQLGRAQKGRKVDTRSAPILRDPFVGRLTPAPAFLAGVEAARHARRASRWRNPGSAHDQAGEGDQMRRERVGLAPVPEGV